MVRHVPELHDVLANRGVGDAGPTAIAGARGRAGQGKGRLPEVVRDDDRSHGNVGDGDAHIVHEPADARQVVEREQEIMPRDVNDLSRVSRQINFHWLPVHDVIGENSERDRFEGVVGEQQDFARVEDVEFRGRGEIVSVPERELGRVAAGELDGGADEVAFDGAGILAAQVAAPGVGRRVRGWRKNAGHAQFPAALGIFDRIDCPISAAVLEVVAPRRLLGLQRGEGVQRTVVIIHGYVARAIRRDDAEIVSAGGFELRERHRV